MSGYNFSEMSRKELEAHAAGLLEEVYSLVRISHKTEMKLRAQQEKMKLLVNMLKMRHGLDVY